MVGDRSRVLVVVREAGFQGLSVVIWSLNQVLAGHVVLALDFGRIELDVVGAAGGRVNSSALNTLHKNLVIQLELNNKVNFLAALSQHVVEHLGLIEGSRETIQEQALLVFRLGELLLEQGDHQIIRDKATTFHDLISLLADLGALLHSGSEKVSRGYVADAQLVLDDWSLSTLTAARWTQQDYVEDATVFSLLNFRNTLL